ncbi:MAG: hypothetical protein Aurels2KO_28100 [Aureliella sp.]
MIRALVFASLLACSQASYGWSECGHHIIALLAFDRLDAGQQSEVIRLIRAHPRFTSDFAVPKGIKNEERWLVGRAGYWPDVARRYPDWNRPTWHYELGASVVLGRVTPDSDPRSVPDDATLKTQQLYASQAFFVCKRILTDKRRSDADRAVALCWVLHIGADLHQPCHAGSLYAEDIFPKGDRGANSIKTKQSGNMHAFWDGLLGRRFYEGDVERRVREISGDALRLGVRTGGEDLTIEFGGRKEYWDNAQKISPKEWVTEGRRLAALTYPRQLRQEIQRYGQLGLELPMQDLNELLLPEEYAGYLGEGSRYPHLAGAITQVRADMAGHRLAKVLAY